ncbi:MAG: TetR/AcrR family transcriptional regulator [Actinomycetota bacterium]
MTRPSSPSRSRPKDRRDQIVAEATTLFIERGYHGVRMEDIAAATGITAGALYRHDRNKQALLERVFTAGQDLWREALVDPAGRSAAARLERALTDLVAVGIDFPQPALLWQREARHLEPDAYRVVRGRLRWFTDRVAELLSGVRKDLEPKRLELLAWAIIAVVGSADRYRATLPRPEFDDTLSAAALAVAAAPVPAGPDHPGGNDPPRSGLAPVTRREHLLSAAAVLFRQKGFLATGIDEVAAEAGMAGSAVYRHFETKAEILEALVTRFTEWRTLETFRALAESTGAADVRRHLIRRYATLALEHPDLVSVTLTESLHLADDTRRAVLRRDDEWQDELAAYAGGDSTGRVLSGAARAVVDDLVRIPHLRPQLDPEQLVLLADAVLTVGT